jgi:hypothetical protein
MNHKRTLAVLIAALVALQMPAVYAGGGTVVKLDGKAVIERKAIKVDVAASTQIYSGDTLSVAEQGIVQMVFEDDSVFVVPGAARLRVDRFTLPTANSGGKAVYTLVAGGVRTITGKVSKGAEDRYELRTEEAIVTVAGSAYMALRCQGSCTRKHKAGLYVRGESGVVTIANSAGKLRLRRGQTAYVKDQGTLAVHVKTSPFDDPLIGANFGVDAEFETEIHPPRIEPEPVASPS